MPSIKQHIGAGLDEPETHRRQWVSSHPQSSGSFRRGLKGLAHLSAIEPLLGSSGDSDMDTQAMTSSDLMSITRTTRAIQVEHVTLRSRKRFAEVRASLEHFHPKLNPELTSSIAAGNTELLQQTLEAGAELSVFLSRDHGSLLRIAGTARRAVQYEIGNPLTASKMSRHQVAAGLYAPLRVILYEDGNTNSVFEYDLPSSLVGQCGDEQVLEVARGLAATRSMAGLEIIASFKPRSTGVIRCVVASGALEIARER